MNDVNLYTEENAVKRQREYDKIVEQLHKTEQELDFWYKLAKNYEGTIVKLCVALTEGRE